MKNTTAPNVESNNWPISEPISALNNDTKSSNSNRNSN